jgi:hypothetical protein
MVLGAPLLAGALKPNGVMMIVDDFDQFAGNEFQRGVSAAGLGFGFADVLGGWLGEGRGFEAKAVLILIKGTEQSVPHDLRRQTEEGWDNYFKDYANDPRTAQDEKTQAFCRGKYIEPVL